MARTTTSPARDTHRALTGPVRTCVGCRRRAAKNELLRVTVGSDPHGHPVVVPDPSSTAPGRGAHLHPTTECLDLAVRRKAFGRALRVPHGPDPAPVAAHVEQHQQPRPAQPARTRPIDRPGLEQQLMSTR